MGLKKLLNFLSSAPEKKPITNRKEVEKKYQYWRFRIFYSIYIGYVFFYFTRKSFTFAMPLIAEDLNLSMSELGLIGTALYLSYGFSKVIGGVLSDYANPQYFMAFGLFMTGVSNFFFGLVDSYWLFFAIWVFNGFFQGWGWPPCTKQLTYWFAKQERGWWWGIKSTSHNVGGALIPLIIAGVAGSYGWRYSMFFAGGISIFISLILLNRLRDVPSSMGLPPVEAYKDPKKKDLNLISPVRKSLPFKTLAKEVLNKPFVWYLSLSYLFIYIIRTACNDWLPLYLMKERGYTMILAASSITWFEIGGLFGMVVAGWCSDRFFSGKRALYMIYCTLALGLLIPMLWYQVFMNQYLEMSIIGLIGFFIFGPQVLVGLYAAELVDQRAACSANGFAGMFAYFGAAITGYPMGKIIDFWGWTGFFYALIFSLFICFILYFIMISQSRSFQFETKMPIEPSPS